MRKRTLRYLDYIEKTIRMYEDNPDEINESIDDSIKNHIVQINFFSHERLIHLIVTVSFALMTIISLALTLLSEQIAPFILTIGFIILLIPYIRHYYLLENSVQKMYEQYDRLMNLKDSSTFKSDKYLD